MSVFTYTASDKNGSVQHGVLNAANTREVSEAIRERGLIPVNIALAKRGSREIAEQDTPSAAIPGAKKSRMGSVAAKDLGIFTSQLGTMLNAGLSITKVLDIQAKQIKGKAMRTISEDLKKKVESGVALSAAFETYPTIFSTLYCAMVKSGEASGNLGNSLIKMTTFLERDAELKRKIKSALSYPTIVLVASVAIIIGLFIFVLPQFVGFLTQLNVPLPAPTKITLAMSDFFVHKWYFIFGGVTAAFFAFRKFKQSPTGKHLLDDISLKMPVLGPLVLMTAMTRFTDTMATLFGAGVPLIQCLEMVGGTMGNEIVSTTINRVIDSVKNGSSLSSALAETKFFTPMVIQMTSVGEESGSLEIMLGKVATFYQSEVDAATEAMTATLNPILMIVVGGMVGWVLISLYLPIFTMAGGM